MIYTHYVPQGQTVDSPYFFEVLKQLTKVHIARKRPEYKRGNWKLHMDNARPHTAHIITEFLQRRGIELVPHPAYNLSLIHI